jgi:hypothetical protein
MLKAPRGTKLWVRLHKEGRVVEMVDLRPDDVETTDLLTNILPAGMTRLELLRGYRDLIQRVRAWPNFEARVRTMLGQIQRRPTQRRLKVPRKLLTAAIKIFFSMDPAARRTAVRLFVHTRRRAPHMIPTVMKLFGAQYLAAQMLPSLLDTIDRQIQLETEGGQLRREQTMFFVPDGFKKPYRSVFPELHARVERGLVDQARVHDALVEVTYDFLTRWGPTFDRFDDHHRVFLEELCDRTVASENAKAEAVAADAPPRGGRPELRVLGAADELRLKRLADEVLRVVEQDLRSFQPEAVHA